MFSQSPSDSSESLQPAGNSITLSHTKYILNHTSDVKHEEGTPIGCVGLYLDLKPEKFKFRLYTKNYKLYNTYSEICQWVLGSAKVCISAYCQ